MIFLALAAAAAIPPVSKPTAAAAQATATIRVLAAVQLKLDGSMNSGAPAPRDSTVTTRDGIALPAKLIEFQ